MGSDGTPAGSMLAQLMAGALMAKGRNASVVASGTDWQAELSHGGLAAVPGFASTLWATLSERDEAPAADELLAELAKLVDPEIGVLAEPELDGGLVWLVTSATAATGITSLSRIGSWSKGKRAAIPALAASRGDGVPGLRTVYGARFSVDEVEDPVARAALLTGGKAALAAFRKTEYTGASGLVALVDPDELAVTDPGVILVNSALGEAEPEHVLALDAVAKVITIDALLDLQAQVVAGGTPSAVAMAWLQQQGIA